MNRLFRSNQLVGSTFLRSKAAMRASPLSQQRRFLDLHEYQSKELATRFGVRVQKGYMAETPEQTEEFSKQLLEEGAPELVLKAQIHAGGRGKGHFNTGYKGGVQFSTDPKEMSAHAKEMIGNNLITKQTAAEGQTVKKVLVHESLNFSKTMPELYLAFLMDRSFDGPVLVASTQGGMDIEEVAENSPEAILKEPIDIEVGILPAQTLKMAKALGFEGELVADAQVQMAALYDMFIKLDCTQIEINPLVVGETREGPKVFCVDAKLNFDDNASFRQKEVFSFRDTSMEDPREVAAGEAGLNYVGLDGSIGCMVNGAGLAMATMDIIHLHGGSPANFLDVGGGATEDQVETAFRILTNDPKVKAIMVNIFGGIMKCDVIAQGIVNAAKTIDLKIPLVVRLEGTNVELGNKILETSGVSIITGTDLDDAAVKAVQAIQ